MTSEFERDQVKQSYLIDMHQIGGIDWHRID